MFISIYQLNMSCHNSQSLSSKDCRQTVDSLTMGQVNRQLEAALPIPTHTWAVANEDKLPNERQLSEYFMDLQ